MCLSLSSGADVDDAAGNSWNRGGRKRRGVEEHRRHTTDDDEGTQLQRINSTQHTPYTHRVTTPTHIQPRNSPQPTSVRKLFLQLPPHPHVWNGRLELERNTTRGSNTHEDTQTRITQQQQACITPHHTSTHTAHPPSPPPPRVPRFLKVSLDGVLVCRHARPRANGPLRQQHNTNRDQSNKACIHT